MQTNCAPDQSELNSLHLLAVCVHVACFIGYLCVISRQCHTCLATVKLQLSSYLSFRFNRVIFFGDPQAQNRIENVFYGG